MKEIRLSGNLVSVVDDDMYEHLSQWNWTFDGKYAVRHIKSKDKNEKNRKIYMHRVVAETPPGFDTDHINRDRLDNRRENLRICTHSQNLANIGQRKNNTSGYRGVSWAKREKKWQVNIWKNGKQIPLGRYDDIEEASRVYREASEKYHGEFSGLNT